MSTEEQEVLSKPLEKLSFGGEGGDKVELPNQVLFEGHVESLKEVQFPGDEEPKISVSFKIDKGDFEGAYLNKSFNAFKKENGTLAVGLKSGFADLCRQLFGGELPSDVNDVVGKPLRFMLTHVTAKESFNGKEYQKATYLPPEKGQVGKTKDALPTDEELAKIFAGEEK